MYCLEHYKGGREVVVVAFQAVLKSKYKEVVQSAMRILQRKFAYDEYIASRINDGPVAVAKFQEAKMWKRGIHDS